MGGGGFKNSGKGKKNVILKQSHRAPNEDVFKNSSKIIFNENSKHTL